MRVPCHGVPGSGHVIAAKYATIEMKGADGFSDLTRGRGEVMETGIHTISFPVQDITASRIGIENLLTVPDCEMHLCDQGT